MHKYKTQQFINFIFYQVICSLLNNHVPFIKEFSDRPIYVILYVGTNRWITLSPADQYVIYNEKYIPTIRRPAEFPMVLT